MTITEPAPVRTAQPPAGRRFGYFVAAAVNVAMIYIVHNVLDWGWPPWITEEWEDVLGLLTLSFVVAMVINLAWIGYDPAWFKSAGNLVQSIISFFVTVRILQVFPFDFSPYEFNWETVARAVLIFALVGVSIAIVVEAVKLIAKGFGGEGPRTADR